MSKRSADFVVEEGSKKRMCRYKKEWEEYFDIGEVKANAHRFNCRPCNTNMSCAHGGKNDVEKHFKSDSHRKCVKSSARGMSLVCTLLIH